MKSYRGNVGGWRQWDDMNVTEWSMERSEFGSGLGGRRRVGVARAVVRDVSWHPYEGVIVSSLLSLGLDIPLRSRFFKSCEIGVVICVAVSGLIYRQVQVGQTSLEKAAQSPSTPGMQAKMSIKDIQ